MDVDISSLKKETGKIVEFSRSKSVSEANLLDINKEVISPLDVEFMLKNTGRGIFLNGQLELMLNLKCTRCLEPFDYFLETEFTREFIFRNKIKNLESEKIEQNLILEPEQDSIEMEPIIRESILLKLPIKNLCSSDCKGLCSHCGMNLNKEQCQCEKDNIDPRLAKLKEFKSKKEHK